MKRGPDYEMAIKNSWDENVEEARSDPQSRKPSVDKFAARMGIYPEIAWHWFCCDDMAAWQFAKNPGKQTLHQKTAAAWIAKLPGVRGFRTLPQNGAAALYVKDGQVLDGKSLANANNPKSVDFQWEVGVAKNPALPEERLTITVYASHKYTLDDGGSQDNQFADLKKFAEEAGGLRKERGLRLLALADGPFYQRTRASSTSGCRMEELKEAFRGSPFGDAMTCADIPAYLAQLHVKLIQSANRPATPEEVQLVEDLLSF